MENDILSLVLRANLALAVTIALVLLLRAPVRRLCGARIAYALWLTPIVAAAACFLPARVVHVVLDAPLHGVAPIHAVQPSYLLWAWGAGALVSLVVLALRQFRFTQALGHLRVRDDLGARVRTAESATHGPAVIGVLRPIIVTPSDFDARFDAEERRIVLAHEHAHLAHGDPWINAIVLLLQCLNWFNPFVHVGARALRTDQELACDAAVLAQAEGVRRRYAEAMLKTHVGAAVPIGCAWPSSNLSSFKERIAMLKRTLPSRTRRLLGVGAIAGVIVAVAAVAWAAQPSRVVPTFAQTGGAHSPLSPDAYAASYVPMSADDRLEGGQFEALDLSQLSDVEQHDWNDLTPEEQAEVRQAISEAREQIEQANEQIRDALREADENSYERYQAIATAQQAALEAQRSLEETRAEREQEVVEAAVALREAQRDMAVAQARLAQVPQAQAALSQAQAEVARAAEQARVNGDARRYEAMRRAHEAQDAQDEDENDNDNDNDN